VDQEMEEVRTALIEYPKAEIKGKVFYFTQKKDMKQRIEVRTRECCTVV